MLLVGISLLPIVLITVKQLQNQQLTLKIRIATVLQMQMVYIATVMVTFSELILDDITRNKLAMVLSLMAFWDFVILEYLLRKMTKSSQLREEEAIRRRFGLGSKSSNDEKLMQRLMRSILVKQTLLILYFLLTTSDNITPETASAFYIGAYTWSSLLEGLPTLIQGIISGIRNKSKGESENELGYTRLEMEEEGLLWGRGLMAKKVELSGKQECKLTLKKMYRRFCQFYDLVFVVSLLVSLGCMVYSIVKEQRLMDQLEVLNELVEKQGYKVPGMVGIVIKSMLIAFVLYVGNKAMKRKDSEYIYQQSKYFEKIAIEGSRHLTQMILCAFAMLIVMYPHLMMTEKEKKTLMGDVVSHIFKRKDMAVGYLGLLVYVVLITLKKLLKTVTT